MAGSMVYRLAVGDARATHMAAFGAALAAAQRRLDRESYNWIAGFHGAPGWYCWHHQFNPRTPLQARLFLPWHRAYLWWLEQALQDRARELPARLQGADIALPWWDWTTTREIPASYRAGPFASSRAWVPTARPPINHVTSRRPGSNPAVRLPLRDEVFHPRTGLLADSDFASFSDRLEDFHDDVHVWVGGDMRDPTVAAYDPVFFAHHCMIDRLWYLWQVRWGASRIPRDLLDLELVPFGMRVSDVINVQRLGYEYATTSAVVPAANGRRARARGRGRNA